MKMINDQLGKHVEISEDTMLNGQARDLVVLVGATLVLNGQVTGELTIERGAHAIINGMVVGRTIVRGTVQVLGMTIGGIVYE